MRYKLNKPVQGYRAAEQSLRIVASAPLPAPLPPSCDLSLSCMQVVVGDGEEGGEPQQPTGELYSMLCVSV